MAQERPLIIVSNDDGIQAKGIRVLTEIMAEIGDVIVVAPNSPQSGKGHAITMDKPLEIYSCDIFGPNIRAYECSGTPADCVKLAKRYISKHKQPDLVVSGINHGSNSSISVIYSGTMSAALEAAIEGIPAIGFSLCSYDHAAEMDHAIPFIKKIVLQALEIGIPTATALNVNIPAKTDEPIKGIRIARQAKGVWQEEFDERTNPYGKKYLWLAGAFENQDKKAHDTDEWAIKNNYISIVPCQFDFTAHHQISWMNEKWEL